jgi:molybdopterin/thiamine biosynthesis adenylyltransferase/rhodanese-related sulfurtransferase
MPSRDTQGEGEIACRGGVVTSSTAKISWATVAWLRARLHQGGASEADGPRPYLVDVRSPEEFARGHLEGALNVPVADGPGTAPGTIRPDHEMRALDALVPDFRVQVVLYCASGARAARAAEVLKARGYRRVFLLEEGYADVAHANDAHDARADARMTRRYGRQMAIPGFGPDAQMRLGEARVLLVGAGGLGSPVALYLAAAGVGTLGIADGDEVALSNLHRQVLHTTGAVGRPKVESARQTLRALNPDVTVITHAHLDADALDRAVERDGFHVIVDGSDNLPTRYAVSDVALARGIPVVSGAVQRLEGQLTTLMPAAAAARWGRAPGPCYRCIFPETGSRIAESCEAAGVLGPVCGTVGSMMATEVIKLLTHQGDLAIGMLLLFDARTSSLMRVTIAETCAHAGYRPPTDPDR